MTRRCAILCVVALAASAVASLSQSEGRNEVAVVIAAARSQIGKTIIYDGSYRKIDYPGGDIPIERGVCTDVLIRAFRAAGYDLQLLVHEDMAAAFDSYPKAWGLSRPDPNIDHRRVPNLATYFRRHGRTLAPSTHPADYVAGDIVVWRLSSGVPHIGLVSSAFAHGGARPLMIHNIGAGTREEDVLFAYAITGHYRFLRPN
jgi:uncharacterized protein YijF (DUF1287 family)